MPSANFTNYTSRTIMGRMYMKIREFSNEDWESVWNILQQVFRSGETFPNDPNTSESEARDYWVSKPKFTYVAIQDGTIVGSYHLKDNQIGLGSHIANAGYVVSPNNRGRGVGTALADHSLNVAVNKGYTAIQFNLVVSTNNASLRLWNKFGFTTIGRIPKAFSYKDKGLVDAYILYKELK